MARLLDKSSQSGRSRKSTGTADRKEAEAFLAEWLVRHGQRIATGPRDPSQILVTAILKDYLLETAPTAQGRIAYAVLALTDFFGGNTVADITPHACRRYSQTRGLSMGTVRRELGALRAAINHAFKNGRLTRTVAVELPARPPARERWLTRKETAKLLRAARTRQARLYLPLFILIGIYTGRRKEAILSLRWPQVDLKAKLINFEIEGRQRTNKKRGVVRIPDRLMPHLIRARSRGSDLGYVLNDHGKRIGDIKKGFAAACKRAELESVIPHTLRHTCATWLMKGGVPIWEAAQFLSMTEETLTRTYAKHHPEFTQAAADAIGRRPGMVRRGA